MTTPMKKNLVLGYFCGIMATVLWGFHTVVIRWLIQQGIDPFMVSVLRLLIGSFILSLFALKHTITTWRKRPSIKYSKFFWVITVSLAMNFILFHKGLEFTIASNAILLEAFSPVMVIIILMLFIPERMKHLIEQKGMPQAILRIVVMGSIGSSLLLINDPKDLLIKSDVKFIGDIIEFAAMFFWALVMLGMHEYQKRNDNPNILMSTAQFLFVAALIVSPFVPWKEILLISPIQWIWIMILGTFSTGISYALWHLASKHLDVFPLITLFNFASIFTVITESIVLKLVISWKLVVGGALILYAAMKAKIINAKYEMEVKPSGKNPNTLA